MKENIQKNIILIIKLNDEYKEKEREIKKVMEEKRLYTRDLTLFVERTKEEKDSIKSYCEKVNKLSDNVRVINIAIQIAKNNIDLMLNEIVGEELLPIIQNYKNKKIGEKTKQKIENEIKEHVKNKYNLIVYFDILQDFSFTSVEVTFDFYTENHKMLGKIKKTSNEKEINEKTFFNMYDCYVSYKYPYIEKPKEEAEKLYEETIKTKQKIDELQKQIDDEKNKINELLKNHLYKYRIDKK